MSNLTKVILGVVAVVVIGGSMLLFRPAAEPTNTTPDNSNVGSAAGPDLPFQYLQWGGGYTYRVTGQCFGGQSAVAAATSTLFSIQNPTGATSTLVLATLYGRNGATTTDILVGTSTTPNPAGAAVATSSLVSNIIAMFSVTNGTAFNTTAGVTMGPGTGYRAPSSGTYPTSQSRIVVGPSEWIVGFSTSTSPTNNGALGATQLGLPLDCTYRFDFERNSAIY